MGSGLAAPDRRPCGYCCHQTRNHLEGSAPPRTSLLPPILQEPATSCGFSQVLLQSDQSPLPCRKDVSSLHGCQRTPSAAAEARNGGRTQCDVGEDAEQECPDVDGVPHLPAAPGGVGAHQPEQAEDHGELQRPEPDGVAAQLPNQEQDEHHERGDEGRRVAVEEYEVPARVAAPQHDVAGDVAVAVVLPEAARRDQTGLVGDGRGQDGQQHQVLPQQLRFVGAVGGSLVFFFRWCLLLLVIGGVSKDMAIATPLLGIYHGFLLKDSFPSSSLKAVSSASGLEDGGELIYIPRNREGSAHDKQVTSLGSFHTDR